MNKLLISGLVLSVSAFANASDITCNVTSTAQIKGQWSACVQTGGSIQCAPNAVDTELVQHSILRIDGTKSEDTAVFNFEGTSQAWTIKSTGPFTHDEVLKIIDSATAKNTAGSGNSTDNDSIGIRFDTSISENLQKNIPVITNSDNVGGGWSQGETKLNLPMSDVHFLSSSHDAEFSFKHFVSIDCTQ